MVSSILLGKICCHDSCITPVFIEQSSGRSCQKPFAFLDAPCKISNQPYYHDFLVKYWPEKSCLGWYYQRLGQTIDFQIVSRSSHQCNTIRYNQVLTDNHNCYYQQLTAPCDSRARIYDPQRDNKTIWSFDDHTFCGCCSSILNFWCLGRSKIDLFCTNLDLFYDP